MAVDGNANHCHCRAQPHAHTSSSPSHSTRDWRKPNGMPQTEKTPTPKTQKPTLSMQFPHKFVAAADPKSCAASVMSFNHNWFSVWTRLQCLPAPGCQPASLAVINANRFMRCNKLGRQIMTTVSKSAQMRWLLSSFFKRPKVAPLCSSTLLAYWLIAKLGCGEKESSFSLPQKPKVFGIYASPSLFLFCESVCKYSRQGKLLQWKCGAFHFVSQRCVLLTTV